MAIKNKKPGIIKESLENISRNLFRDHMEIITQLIGDSSGIYALYDENELYYVGRATELKQRVKHHLKDRHDAQWTHFSLFLVKRNDHIGDIESLLIRVAAPVGNRAKPKGRDSKQLLQRLRNLIKQKHNQELSELLPGRKRSVKINKSKGKEILKGLVEKRTPIYHTYKGKEHKAILTPTGTITYKNKKYKSLTGAAMVIVYPRKTVNGWTFWRIKNSNDEWITLNEYARS